MYNKKALPRYRIGDVVIIARCAVDHDVGKYAYIKDTIQYPDGHCTYTVKFFEHDTPRGFVEECLELVT